MKPHHFTLAALPILAVLAGHASISSAELVQPIRSLEFAKTPSVIRDLPACPNDVCPGLGNGFYLPKGNALSIQTGGNSFFLRKKVGECATASSAERNSRGFEQADSMEKLNSYVMAQADLSGSYKTAVLTASGTSEMMTGAKSDITTTFHSAHMDIQVIKNSVDFNQNSACFSRENLDPQFLKHFESLAEIDLAKVGDAASWQPYVQFLNDQGSHVMMQQMIGSRFEQWESSMSSDSEIENTLKAKACAEVEGVLGGGGWSVKGCAAYTKEEKEKALKTQSKSLMVVMGGTEETRAALTKNVNEENLNKFIDSAANGSQAVRFIFKPIWDLLIAIYTPGCSTSGKGSTDCKFLQRAINLQAAYEGWTAVGCDVKQDNDSAIFQTMQVDSTTTQGINTYRCRVSKTGCRSDDSCHLGGAGSVCYCYGSQCIDQGDQLSGTNMYRDKVRGDKSGSYDEGVNNSCYYKFIAHCNCDTSWAGGLPDRNIYLQATQQNLENARLLKKNANTEKKPGM